MTQDDIIGTTVPYPLEPGQVRTGTVIRLEEHAGRTWQVVRGGDGRVVPRYQLPLDGRTLVVRMTPRRSPDVPVCWTAEAHTDRRRTLVGTRFETWRGAMDALRSTMEEEAHGRH